MFIFNRVGTESEMTKSNHVKKGENQQSYTNTTGYCSKYTAKTVSHIQRKNKRIAAKIFFKKTTFLKNEM